MSPMVFAFSSGALLLLIFLVLGAGVGVLMAVRGWRGRRVDDHPVCRRCGFDLSGTPDAAEAKTPCPECGALAWPRIGNRRRRPGLTWGGVLLVLLCVSGLGAVGYGAYDPARLAPHKPLWLLRIEARYAGAVSAEVALQEIAARVRGGGLGPATLAALMADAVRPGPAGNAALVNASPGDDWDALAVTLMKAGVGTDAERLAIAKSWFTFSVETRPRVRQGGDVPLRIRHAQHGPPPPHRVTVKKKKPTIRIQDEVFTLGISGGGGGSNTRGSGGSSGSSGTTLRPGPDLPRGLGPGRHGFEIELDVAVTDGSNGPVWAQWTETHRGGFEYVDPAAGDPVELLRDPNAAAAVERNTKLRDMKIEVRPYGSNAMIDIDNVHAPIAYRVYLQRGESRWEYTTLNARLTGGGYGLGAGGKVPDELEDGARVDLVFEPDRDVARQTIGLTQILDHAFVISGVEIVR